VFFALVTQRQKPDPPSFRVSANCVAAPSIVFNRHIFSPGLVGFKTATETQNLERPKISKTVMAVSEKEKKSEKRRFDSAGV
jgi:hypothetical protein